jgi:hypothetical protein
VKTAGGALAAVFTVWLSAGPSAAASPLLVELFTSQGCSSCPPADEILAGLAARPDIVAITFHVSYWDSIGWADRLAIPEATRRQTAYRTTFHNPDIYTPQMVIDGRIAFPGNDPRAVSAALARARNDRTAGPDIVLTRTEGAVQIDIAAAAHSHKSAIWYAVVAPPQTAHVDRGENRGRTLVSVNTVRDLRTAGSYDGALITQTIPVTADQAVAVWLQPANLGDVTAAAFLAAKN